MPQYALVSLVVAQEPRDMQRFTKSVLILSPKSFHRNNSRAAGPVPKVKKKKAPE